MKSTILGVTGIAIGGVIYLLWRQDNLVMFSWFDSMGLRTVVSSLRESTNTFISILPKWVRFSLPNGLWLFGGVLLLSNIWKDEYIQRYVWIFIFSSIAFGSEFAQLTGILQGTFDSIDLLLMTISATAAILINNHQFSRARHD